VYRIGQGSVFGQLLKGSRGIVVIHASDCSAVDGILNAIAGRLPLLSRLAAGSFLES
jgi:hypothetical protein